MPTKTLSQESAMETQKAVPYAGHFNADKDDLNNNHRLKQYRKFMGWDTVPYGLRVLDIGAPNYISRQLGITHNTFGDLNEWVRAPYHEYDVITCFEVMNKIFDQQTFLESTRALLRFNGRLYLSVPLLYGIAWEHHKDASYVELKPNAVRTLATYVGFKPVRYYVGNPWPLKFVFYGIRPPFRWLHNRFQLWEFEKI
jgi:hypothetical protein